jgi:hypothetical protein
MIDPATVLQGHAQQGGTSRLATVSALQILAGKSATVAHPRPPLLRGGLRTLYRAGIKRRDLRMGSGSKAASCDEDDSRKAHVRILWLSMGS